MHHFNRPSPRLEAAARPWGRACTCTWRRRASKARLPEQVRRVYTPGGWKGGRRVMAGWKVTRPVTTLLCMLGARCLRVATSHRRRLQRDGRPDREPTDTAGRVAATGWHQVLSHLPPVRPIHTHNTATTLHRVTPQRMMISQGQIMLIMSSCLVLGSLSLGR